MDGSVRSAGLRSPHVRGNLQLSIWATTYVARENEWSAMPVTQLEPRKHAPPTPSVLCSVEMGHFLPCRGTEVVGNFLHGSRLRQAEGAFTIVVMPFRRMFRFCSEELQRTWRGLVVAYNTLRELDEMTLGTLLAYLRDR